MAQDKIKNTHFDEGLSSVQNVSSNISFNNTSIFTGYLKQLLHNFNLPKFKVYTQFDKNYFNKMHEEHPEILQTTTNTSCLYYMPYIKDGYIQQYINGQWVTNTKNSITKTNQYFYGAKYLNYTKCLNITNNIYDTYTHEYLGDYLRFLRDYDNINLMPMYNCFSNKLCDKLYYNISSKCPVYTKLDDDTLHTLYSVDTYVGKYVYNSVECRYIKVTSANKNSLNIIPYSSTAMSNIQTQAYTETQNTGTNILFNTSDKNYKIYMLPVKLFKSYTIAIESDSTIEICCGLYGMYQDTRTKFDIIPAITYQRFTNMHFAQPKLFTGLFNLNTSAINTTLLTEIAQNEDDLKLFIKLPKNNNSTIVVLEGNYLSWNDEITQLTNIDQKRKKQKNKSIINIDKYSTDTKLIAPLQLLRFNTKKQHPFANRLIEFLSDNAITSNEDISDNVKRVQQVLLLNTNQNNYSPIDDGIWDANINILLYDYLSSHPKLMTFDAYHDITGFVDKDVEQKYCGKLQDNSDISIMNYDLYKED